MGSNNYTASGDRAGLGNSQATQRHERLFISPVPLTVRLRKKYYRLTQVATYLKKIDYSLIDFRYLRFLVVSDTEILVLCFRESFLFRGYNVLK
ncbi:MAG: hypothetical protein EBE86_002315 [Hormoscilla sp. GUM202]|nr:hypothetical protein [Hormoscilla sp. GUM202]